MALAQLATRFFVDELELDPIFREFVKPTTSSLHTFNNSSHTRAIADPYTSQPSHRRLITHRNGFLGHYFRPGRRCDAMERRRR